jgi:peptidoglycan/xylan/chitin deacetylase (PgdA/CDA1 family)
MAQAHREAVNQWMKSELTLLRLTQAPPCSDPDSLSPAQVDWFAEQEVISGNTEERRVAFTFDAGSGAEPWPAIRAACAEADVRLTMFLTGDFVRRYPEVVRQMVADGHDIQSHSDTHPDLTELDAPAVRSQFTGFQEALDEAVGAHVPVCLWRPPFGARSPAVRQAAAELGLLEIYWSPGGDTTGWREGATTERVVNRVTGYMRPGQIFVMHINSRADAEALPTLLAQAEEEGYTVGDVWSVLTPEQRMPPETPAAESTSTGSSEWEPGSIP